MSHQTTDAQIIRGILLLRICERSVKRALSVHAAKPTERTLLAIGACLYRLEEAERGMQDLTAYEPAAAAA
jgi:hypothetical protein